MFYVDLSEYLLLSKEVEISDFLVSMAGAMSEQVQQQFIDTLASWAIGSALPSFYKAG